jgi:predicted nucleic acid-binding protein
MVARVNAYVDTSALASALYNDVFAERSRRALAANAGSLSHSDFAATEFASVVARRVRANEFSIAQAEDSFRKFDATIGRILTRVPLDPSDIGAAERLVKRFELGLKAPDAIHLAVVLRLNLSLLTFDRGMARAASSLGIDVVAA